MSIYQTPADFTALAEFSEHESRIRLAIWPAYRPPTPAMVAFIKNVELYIRRAASARDKRQFIKIVDGMSANERTEALNDIQELLDIKHENEQIVKMMLLEETEIAEQSSMFLILQSLTYLIMTNHKRIITLRDDQRNASIQTAREIEREIENLTSSNKGFKFELSLYQ